EIAFVISFIYLITIDEMLTKTIVLNNYLVLAESEQKIYLVLRVAVVPVERFEILTQGELRHQFDTVFILFVKISFVEVVLHQGFHRRLFVCATKLITTRIKCILVVQQSGFNFAPVLTNWLAQYKMHGLFCTTKTNVKPLLTSSKFFTFLT